MSKITGRHVFLILILIFAISSPGLAGPFQDVRPGHWAYEAIRELTGSKSAPVLLKIKKITDKEKKIQLEILYKSALIEVNKNRLKSGRVDSRHWSYKILKFYSEHFRKSILEPVEFKKKQTVSREIMAKLICQNYDLDNFKGYDKILELLAVEYASELTYLGLEMKKDGGSVKICFINDNEFLRKK